VALTYRDKSNMIVHRCERIDCVGSDVSMRSAIRMLFVSHSPDARWAVDGQTQTFRSLSELLQSMSLN
jgi:hypothetical protein